MNTNDYTIKTDGGVVVVNLPKPQPGKTIQIVAKSRPILVVPSAGTSFRNVQSWPIIQAHSARYYKKPRGRARWRARKRERAISYQMGPDGLTIQY